MVRSEILRAGDLTAVADGDRVHSICWKTIEVLRGITAPVRDGDWGTCSEVETDRATTTQPGSMTYHRAFRFSDIAASGRLDVDLNASGQLVAVWTFTAEEDLSVNRAGFCLLHPLRGVEGGTLDIVRPDGTTIATAFPSQISPAQPAKDIAGLRHEVMGIGVDIAFEGDVFEMEDQRNWSDASYKTYCRPLALPRPYTVRAGETLRQKVTLTFTGAPVVSEGVAADAAPATMPEILLAAQPSWLGGTRPAGCALLARFGQAPWSDADLDALKDCALDAEIVIPDGQDPLEVLQGWGRLFQSHGLAPRHVTVLPAAYLASHQPDGVWPDGATPSDCVQAARVAFPKARIGAGVLTNFTEFNRCRPAPGLGDYVTHGNSATVHAADDLSVMQTLEAMPAIFDSARKIAGDRAYRLGLTSIAMRSNPYGDGLQLNPKGEKRTMTDTDPRQTQAFAATYAIGMVAQAARAGVEAICVAAPSGPFGMDGPLKDAVTELAGLAGAVGQITVDRGRFTIAAGGTTLVANCSAQVWADAPGGALETAQWRRVQQGGAA